MEDERRPLLSTPRPQIQPWVSVKKSPYKQGRRMGDTSHQVESPEQTSPVKKQNSVVTIFAVWNTMMGTSLLAMPWGVEMAGLALGTGLTLAMGALCLYTAHANIRAHALYGSVTGEVSQLAKDLLGRVAEVASKLFSVIVLLGANLVYWILMSNFLFNSVSYVHDSVSSDPSLGRFINFSTSVICPTWEDTAGTANMSGAAEETVLFYKWWNLDLTVPIFLALLITPLLNFKSPTFFTKFNSLGTLSVMYLVAYVVGKAWSWGWVNMELRDSASPHFTPMAVPTFPATAGMLALSYFIHNIIITIMRSNRQPKNNGRDLTVAYVLVVITYLTIGVLFYISFPLSKNCIQDNLLNNFTQWDPATVGGRVFLLFQLVTVFPLIAYMLRNEVLRMVTGVVWPGCCPVILFNVVLVIICVLTAIFLPHIGTIIRYTGAVSGMVHIFTLPCLLRLAVERRTEAELSPVSVFIHLAIPVLGAANLIGQFFVTG